MLAFVPKLTWFQLVGQLTASAAQGSSFTHPLSMGG
jgi:hypothetical protein